MSSSPNSTELQHVAKSPAYEAGFTDGQSWNYAPEEVRVEGWAKGTIAARGEREFGLHVGLSEEQIAQRGEAWKQACEDYDRGCVDGITYARSAR